MTDGPILRAATAADVDAIAEIWHPAWHDGHAGHVPDGLLVHRTLDQFRERVPGRVPDTTVAVVDGDVVGFATVLDDEVEELFVAAAARGTPVARLLLGDAEQRVAARHAEAWLAVVAGNARARRFYEREGWSDGGPLDYEAETADGRYPVPCRRYVKAVRPEAWRPTTV